MDPRTNQDAVLFVQRAVKKIQKLVLSGALPSDFDAIAKLMVAGIGPMVQAECAHCGRSFVPLGRVPHRRYCGATCRESAKYEERKMRAVAAGGLSRLASLPFCAPGTRIRRVFDAVAEGGEASAAEVARSVGIEYAQACQKLGTLVSRGYLTRDEDRIFRVASPPPDDLKGGA